MTIDGARCAQDAAFTVVRDGQPRHVCRSHARRRPARIWEPRPHGLHVDHRPSRRWSARAIVLAAWLGQTMEALLLRAFSPGRGGG